MVDTQSPEPEAFRAFEQTGWDRVPSQYHDSFETLTPQAAGPLLDAAGVRGGMDVLDVACGPGYVSAAAAARGARVTGMDFAAGMIEQARRAHPGIEFREGDAEGLPFEDAAFDALVINFGIMHFARAERALAEAHRVLRLGGRIAFTVWDGPDVESGFSIVQRAIERHGTVDVPTPEGPPRYHFADAGRSRETLGSMGFESPDTKALPIVWRLPSADALLDRFRESTVRTAGLIRAQPEAAAGEIRATVRAAVEAYRVGEEFAVPMPAVVSWGMRGGSA